jgi:hypothetical protein
MYLSKWMDDRMQILCHVILKVKFPEERQKL